MGEMMDKVDIIVSEVLEIKYRLNICKIGTESELSYEELTKMANRLAFLCATMANMMVNIED